MAYLVTRRIGKHLYRYEVESYWDSAKKQSRQRILRFVGRVDKQGKVLVAPAVRVDSVSDSIPVGPLSFFYAMARELDLVAHIKEVLDVRHDVAVHILCLVLNQIGAKRPLAELPAWVARSPIPRWEKLREPLLTRESFDRALHSLCHSTRDGGLEDLGLALQQAMTKVWRGDSREPAQFYYDITRQIYHDNSCDYAEPGYFPGGTKRNVLGFGMVTSRHRQHPVLCRAIRGSRSDTLTVQDVVNHLKAWGFGRLTLILDRGMISRENVEFVVKSGFNLVGLVPETHQEAWTYIAHWPGDELERSQYLVERGSGAKVYVRSWRAPLMGRKHMRVALVLDKMRASREQIERDGILQAVERTSNPKRLRELREDLGALAVSAPGRRGFEVDKDAVRDDRRGDGRFLMFSTDPALGAEEMFRIYFQRDEIEKAFRTLKGELSLGPIRYQRRDRIDAYTTVVYMAYLLWSWAQQRLKEKYPSLTVTQALKLVGDVHAVRFQSGKRTLEWTTRRTPEQEKIMKLVGALRLLPSG
ncbi:MAG: transposase [Elusimicrobia bacterium]|nr:transposase [Elusimicrobiota bacterium]